MILAANDIITLFFIFERYWFILAYAITPYNWMYTPPKFYFSTSKSIGVGMDFKDCYHNHKFIIICISAKLYSQWKRFKIISIFSHIYTTILFTKFINICIRYTTLSSHPSWSSWIRALYIHLIDMQ